MKITALLVLKCNPDGSDPVILANASDVSHFGYFQRSSVKEFIIFVGRTVAKRTAQGQRQSVQHEEYKVHTYNRNGLCALGFMDDHYPIRSAFSLLNQASAIYFFLNIALFTTQPVSRSILLLALACFTTSISSHEGTTFIVNLKGPAFFCASALDTYLIP